MKKLWLYLREHVRHDFHLQQYILIASFIALALVINYRIDFEDSFLDRNKGLVKVLFFFITYATGYYAVLLTTTVFRHESSFWRNKTFWTRSLLVLFILSLDASMPFLREFIYKTLDSDVRLWTWKVSHNLMSLVIILPTLLWYYNAADKDSGHGYGLSPKRFDLRPYFVMLAIMSPLIVIAIFESSFGKQYPMYSVSEAHNYLGVPEWLTVVIYEISYGLDFVTVEFLFRGFMVLGMVSILGRQAILPMVTVYCFIHFGKPAGEAISSVFGGYILGVIALETRSIWGGIIVHIGIAWMMELAAYIAKQ